MVSTASSSTGTSTPWSFPCGAPTSGTAATVAASAPFLNPSNLTLCVTMQAAGASGSQTPASVTATVSYPFAFMLVPLSVANGTLTATTVLPY